MGKHVLSGIIGALVAGVTVFAISFFSKYPFREGELSFKLLNGAELTLKVANSEEITELIRAALQNEKSALMMRNSLLSVIEGLPSGCILGEKLCNMVERRQPPFCAKSVPVVLIYDPKVPEGIAAACENSYFLGKRIVVYPIAYNGGGDPMNSLNLHVDGRLAVSCIEGGEILRVNSEKVEGFNSRQVMAKRDF